ncbi:MAG: hypothetical protein M3P33_04305 [bacterium]|nr:hypothetical protein [bacterium]
MNKIFVLILISIFFIILISPVSISAQQSHPSLPTATIINPIRGPQLGLEKSNLLESLQGQWQFSHLDNPSDTVPITWLWQYSALEHPELISFAKENILRSKSQQEFGIFLEIDQNTALQSGVDYKGKTAWYRSDGLFLSSYDLYERKKIIDNVFQKFKNIFGYYPKSVGAWWIGAESIKYMQERYQIASALQCADQFNTDAYSIWGTPYSIPYISSSKNAAIPAKSNDSSNVVIMQWAPRDPLLAYGNSVTQSTFSAQDYQLKNYDISYFNYLKDIYLKKPGDQFVFGLEAGLIPPTAYQGQYRTQILQVAKDQVEKKLIIQNMTEYAKSFLKSKQTFPPTRFFLTKDQFSNNQSFWYHSQFYRIGIQKLQDQIKIVDIRDYSQSTSDDFFLTPNTNPFLFINTPAIIDTVRTPKEYIISTSKSPLSIITENNIVTLKSDREIAQFKDNKITIYQSNQKQQVYNFKSPFIINPHYLIFTFLALCLLIIIIKLKKVGHKIITIIFLVLNLFLLYPILSSGINSSLGMTFHQKSLFLFNYVSLLPLPPDQKISIFFQYFPILLIVLLVLLISQKNKSTQKNIIWQSVVFVLFSLVFYQPNILLDLNNIKLILKLSAYLYLVSGIVITFMMLYSIKRLFPLVIIFSLITILISIYNFQFLLKTENRISLTSYELSALNFVFYKKQNVTYHSPNPALNTYRAIQPLLYLDYSFGQKLTNVKWSKTDKYPLQYFPRYLSVEPTGDIKNSNKVFDNAQIRIFKL